MDFADKVAVILKSSSRRSRVNKQRGYKIRNGSVVVYRCYDWMYYDLEKKEWKDLGIHCGW